MRDSNFHQLPKTIIFGERSNGSSFPTYGVEIPLNAENEEHWRNYQDFVQDRYLFSFDDNVSHNGWWAYKPGVKGVCQVHIS